MHDILHPLRVFHCKFQGGTAEAERLHKSKILKKLEEYMEQSCKDRVY
jgi:hypothetical protein